MNAVVPNRIKILMVYGDLDRMYHEQRWHDNSTRRVMLSFVTWQKYYRNRVSLHEYVAHGKATRFSEQ